MIFIRFDGRTCIEGVDLRSLDMAVAAIQKAYPGKAVRTITNWAVLQWAPDAGSGRIEIGNDVILVSSRSPLTDERSAQPFFLPASSVVNLVPDNPDCAPIRIRLDQTGHLIESFVVLRTDPVKQTGQLRRSS